MARSYLTRAGSGYRGINDLLKVLTPKSGLAAPVNAVAASLATALAGSNNDLDFTAKRKGTYGNGITIRYVNPGVETATEVVTVVGKAITVTLRSVSGTLSTSAQVKAAIDAHAVASTLVTVANHSSDTGAGNVIALAATNLTSGTDGTDGGAFEQVIYSGYLYILVADVAPLTGAADTWYKVAITLA